MSHRFGTYRERLGERACRICGCTDFMPCIDDETGEACHWVEEDLCSACLGKLPPAERSVPLPMVASLVAVLAAWEGGAR